MPPRTQRIPLLGWLAGLLIVAALANSARAQSFRVMACAPGVEYRQGGQWQPLQVGKELSARHAVKVPRGAYAALVMNGQQTIELKKAGTHPLNRFGANRKEDNSIAERYLNYVMQQATQNSNKDMQLPGGVRRSASRRSIPYQLAPRGKTQVVPDSLTFAWTGMPAAEAYRLKLYGPEQEELMTFTVEDTMLSLALGDLLSKTGTCYYWSVAPRNFQTQLELPKQCFRPLPKQKADRIRAELAQLTRQWERPYSAADYALLASFYQQHNLQERALQAYHHCLRAAPNVQTYEQLYAYFLYDSGLKQLARQHRPQQAER